MFFVLFFCVKTVFMLVSEQFCFIRGNRAVFCIFVSFVFLPFYFVFLFFLFCFTLEELCIGPGEVLPHTSRRICDWELLLSSHIFSIPWYSRNLISIFLLWKKKTKSYVPRYTSNPVSLSLFDKKTKKLYRVTRVM